MTREEAISEWTFRSNHIKKWLDEYGEEPSIRHYVELIDMAIEALSQPIVAKHFDIQSGYIYCSPQIAENVKVVVRCKDCRHGEHIQIPLWENRDIDKAPSQFHDFIKCHKFHIKGFNETLYLGDDDYCSHGERREP